MRICEICGKAIKRVPIQMAKPLRLRSNRCALCSHNMQIKRIEYRLRLIEEQRKDGKLWKQIEVSDVKNPSSFYAYHSKRFRHELVESPRHPNNRQKGPHTQAVR